MGKITVRLFQEKEKMVEGKEKDDSVKSRVGAQ